MLALVPRQSLALLAHNSAVLIGVLFAQVLLHPLNVAYKYLNQRLVRVIATIVSYL